MNVPDALNTDYNFDCRTNFMLLLGKQIKRNTKGTNEEKTWLEGATMLREFHYPLRSETGFRETIKIQRALLTLQRGGI